MYPSLYSKQTREERGLFAHCRARPPTCSTAEQGQKAFTAPLQPNTRLGFRKIWPVNRL